MLPVGVRQGHAIRFAEFHQINVRKFIAFLRLVKILSLGFEKLQATQLLVLFKLTRREVNWYNQNVLAGFQPINFC